MVKLGIIGAMAVEVRTLKQQLINLRSSSIAGMEFCEGSLEGLPVVVVQCGVGKVHAALCVQILCDCFGVTHLVNTGVAGSLSAELDIGDFVISRDAMYHDFTCHALNPDYKTGQIPGLNVQAFPADERLVFYAQNAAQQVHPGHARVGRIASGDQFVASKTQKAQIVEDTGAVCTEMEGGAIAHAAWSNGVPFVVIRAISDKADDSAQMDYPSFEAAAAERCARVTQRLAAQLKAAEE